MARNSFKPGNKAASGHGRPKGTGTRQQLFREMIAPHKHTLINKALEMAANGNEAMLKLMLERMLPPKYQEVPLDIKGKDSQETTGKLLDNVAQGEITPDEASKIAAIVQKDAEISNQKIMIEKITNLEATMDASNKMDLHIDTENQPHGQEMDSGSNQPET